MKHQLIVFDLRMAIVPLGFIVSCTSQPEDTAGEKSGNEVSLNVGELPIRFGEQFYGETIARVETSNDMQIGYYENDQIAFSRSLSNGLAHGPTNAYYPSGRKRYTQSFVNGQLNGRYIIYDERGNVISDEVWMGGARLP